MASRLVRLTCPAQIRALLVTVVLVVALAAAAALAAAPASATSLTPNDYIFISGIGPTTTPAYDFSGSSPDGIAVDADGNVYVTLPYGIAKFTSAGAWVCDYTGDNGYNTGGGYGLDVDSSNGTVYYAESTSNRVVMLRPASGGLSASEYEWKAMIGRNGGDGSSGDADGEFSFPADVAVDGGYLYVADKSNNRIQKFAIDYTANTLTWKASWGANDGDGTAGSGNVEFTRPSGIATDHNGHLFVADQGNSRIQELTTAGAFVTKWGVGTPSSDPLYLLNVNGIDADAQGNVYVTDFEIPTSWVNKYAPGAGGTYAFATRLGGWGTANGQFTFPWSCAVAPSGYLYVTDTQNNQIKRFARDATAPVVTPLAFPSGWVKTLVGHPELTATDPTVTGQYTSGGVSIYYSKTGGAPWSEYLEPFASLDFSEGDNIVTYYATDAVGNESTPAAAHVRIDNTVPVTTASGLPAGWSKTAVAVTLTPSNDGFAPIVSTEYRLQGAATWTTYEGPFNVGAEGIATYEYRSTDNAGNVEVTKTLTVRIDTTAPVTTASGLPAGWSKAPVTIAFVATDALSGVATTEYSTDGGATWTSGATATTTAQGVTTVQYRATDGVGNVEGAKTLTVRIDNTAPVTTASGVLSGWSKTAAVTLTPNNDGFSPIASTEYRLKGASTWTTYGSPFPVNAEGTATYEYRSTDGAGNVEGAKTLTVRIDNTAPATTASGVPAGWSKAPVTLAFAATDALSGIATTEYSTDGGATWISDATVTMSAQGVTTVQYRATDGAGNVEGAKTLTVRIDSRRPAPKALANKSVKRNKTVKLPYRVKDGASPQAKVRIRIYKGTKLRKSITVGMKTTNKALSYSFTCKLPKGKYRWKVYATDLAGNTQAKPGVRTLTVK